MHHVDSVFRRYVVLQQGRAARVLPASPKFCMHACDVNTAVFLSLRHVIDPSWSRARTASRCADQKIVTSLLFLIRLVKIVNRQEYKRVLDVLLSLVVTCSLCLPDVIDRRPRPQQKTLLCIFLYITCIYDNILKI